MHAGRKLQAPPLVAVAQRQDLPLSFAQQRLWFLDQLEPGSSAYNIPNAVRLSGKLDAIALERGLRELVRRHEALRTTFADMDGQPVQVIEHEDELMREAQASRRTALVSPRHPQNSLGCWASKPMRLRCTRM